MTDAVRVLLDCLGEDPNRHGLQRTPLRMAKALMAFTTGYQFHVDGKTWFHVVALAAQPCGCAANLPTASCTVSQTLLEALSLKKGMIILSQ